MLLYHIPIKKTIHRIYKYFIYYCELYTKSAAIIVKDWRYRNYSAANIAKNGQPQKLSVLDLCFMEIRS